MKWSEIQNTIQYSFYKGLNPETLINSLPIWGELWFCPSPTHENECGIVFSPQSTTTKMKNKTKNKNKSDKFISSYRNRMSEKSRDFAFVAQPKRIVRISRRLMRRARLYETCVAPSSAGRPNLDARVCNAPLRP